MDMQVSWNRRAGVLVGSLSGRVDSANGEAFHDALGEGIREGERALVLDCAQLSYIGSAGLRALLAAARKFQGPDQAIGMCGLTGPIRSVVALSGFDKIIPVHESMTEALTAVSGEEHGDDAGGGEEAAGDDPDASGAPIPLRNPIDLDVVGDNIAQMADFTIEKHEFANGDLPADVRERALSEIEDALWKLFELRAQRRQEVVAEALRTAAETLDEVVGRG